MKKTKMFFMVSLILMIIPNNKTYAYGECDPCIWQFSANMDSLRFELFYATAYECTPIFGSNNGAGLSDIYGYITEGAGGIGAIFTGLDMASDYNDCVQRLEDDFNRGLDALSTSLEECFRRSGCYLAGWGY